MTADFFLRPTTAAQLLVVLVGIPGSGKSSFSRCLIADAATAPTHAQWHHISQVNACKRRKKCIRAAERAMLTGEHVLIDRCNFDEEQRSPWLSLEGAQNTHRVAVFFDVRKEEAMARLLSRKPTIDGHAQADHVASERKLWGIVKQAHEWLRPPKLQEGFHEVLTCCGDDPESFNCARMRLNSLRRSAENYFYLGPGLGNSAGMVILDSKARNRKALEEFCVPPMPGAFVASNIDNIPT